MNIAIIVSGIYNLGLAFFLILKAPPSYFKKHFLIFTIYTSLWILTNAVFITIPSTLLFRTTYAIGAFMPVLALMWILSFEKEKQLPFYIPLTAYFMALIFGIFCYHENIFLKDLLVFSDGIKEIYGYFFPLYSIYMGSVFIYLIYKIYKFTRIFSGLKKEQAKYIFMGVLTFGCTALFVSFILPLFGISQFAFYDSASIIIFNSFVVFAITKSRLMDITVIINKLLAWLVTTLLLGSIYTAMVWIYKSIVSSQINLLFIIMSILFGALVGQYFNKIRLFLQSTGEKTFLTGKIDLTEIVGEIAKDLAKVVGFDDLEKLLDHIRVEHLEIEELKIIKPEHLEDALKNEILNKKTIVERNKKIFIPCFSVKDLVAVIEIGRKMSEDAFNEDEVELLELLAPQFTIVLERIRPYEQIKEDYIIAQKAVEKAQQMATLGALALQTEHEIQNPIAAIDLHAGLLRDHVGDKEYIEKFIDLVKRNSFRIGEIISNMREFGTAGKREKILTDINNLLFDKVLFLAEGHLKKKRISVEKEIGEIPRIFIDPSGIEQVFINIILNAIQAMQEEGILTISTQTKTVKIRNENVDCIVIKIKDNGEGISKENLEKVFLPMFTTRYEGVGLGLSISYRIVVEEHGGDISIESEKNKGTLAAIALPSLQSLSVI